MDREQYINSFLSFEDEHNMFQVTMGGVAGWHLFRANICEDLANVLGVWKSLSLQSANIADVKKTWRDILRENIVCNQFFAHKRDVLILPKENKYQDDDGYFRCIFTDGLDRAMTRTHYLLAGKSFGKAYVKQRSKNLLYLKPDLFEILNKIMHNYQVISKSELENKLIKPIEESFQITIPISYKQKWLNHYNAILASRKKYIYYFNYILNKIKPKVILLVCYFSFDTMILCEVAKKRNIPVIELQHGIIDRLEAPYNFLRKRQLIYFPDYFFAFGQLVKQNIRFPIDDKCIIPVGYPELESKYKKYRKVKKKPKRKKQILFISQGVVEIVQYAETVANILDDQKYSIIIKLHPSEYGNWEKKYKNYLYNTRIKFVGDTNKTIHSYLAEADWVVGSCSTSLWEATMFDAKIAVIKEFDYLIAKELYQNGHAILVDSPQNLAEEIISDTFKANSTNPFFEKNSINNMLKWIDKIIEENNKNCKSRSFRI